MGALRLYLALCVALLHFGLTARGTWMDSTFAVPCFFVISGYYMAMVIAEKYPGLTSRYYLNRVLRIWPAYLAVLLGSAVLAVLIVKLAHGRAVSPLGAVMGLTATPTLGLVSFLAVSSITIIGQEWAEFLRVMPGTGGLTWGWLNAEGMVLASSFYLLPQAWSLGIEEVFYLLAPWYTRMRNGALGVIAALGFAQFAMIDALEAGGRTVGLGKFPPACLSLFALGILGYRWGKSLPGRMFEDRRWTFGACLGCALAVGTSQFLGAPKWLERILILVPLAAALPLVMRATKDLKWDRVLARFSYPLYLTHIASAWAASAFLPGGGGGTFGAPEKLALGLSLGSAALIVVLIELPLEPLRQRVAAQGWKALFVGRTMVKGSGR